MFFITFFLRYRAFFVGIIYVFFFFASETMSALVSSDTLSGTLCFLLWNLVSNRVFVMFREKNEAVSALICSDTVSETVSDTLCDALSFSP